MYKSRAQREMELQDKIAQAGGFKDHNDAVEHFNRGQGNNREIAANTFKEWWGEREVTIQMKALIESAFWVGVGCGKELGK